MNAQLEIACNRRSDTRETIYEKAWYLGFENVLRRTELINYSNGGARLTTALNVRAGDRFELLTEFTNGAALKATVEVRWTEVLPCGTRQVVGVQSLKDRYEVVDCPS